MEVTRKNFKEALPLVSESINTADFLVIDTEFTGLINGKDVSVFDSPKEYYNTLFQGATDFLLIQFGLCAFRWDEELKYYVNDAYNFYLFPHGKPGLERMFLCQSSSLEFLASQGFDFNKLIKEGISYMTEPTETRLRENLTEKQKSDLKNKDTVQIPEEHKAQIDEICEKIKEFLDEKKSKEILIDRCNAFIRRLLFQELRSRFKGKIFVETKITENSNRVLKVSRVTSEEEIKSKGDEKKEKEWEDLEEAVGFSKVARMIAQSNKIVVGHNMLLDVIHTLNHFFSHLPADYYSFKEFAHCMFPWLVDTKYMSSLPPFKDKVSSSVLTHLLATLSEPPFSIPKIGSKKGRGYKQMQEKHHEAGYDAYVTGLCFLGMFTHLAGMRGEGGEHARVSADSPALRPYLNKLYLVKTAHQSSPYMHLGGDEPTLTRDHVFYLVFPKEWQRKDINNLFSPYGPITVQFLDETSALVGLARRDFAKDVISALGKNERFSIMPYNKYAQMRGDRLNNGQNDKSWHRKVTEQPAYMSPGSNQKAIKKGTMVTSKWRAQTATGTVAPSPSVNRKRTSSGLFQVDETEPQQKKQEIKVNPNYETCKLQTDVCKEKTKQSSNDATLNKFWQVEKSDVILQKKIEPSTSIEVERNGHTEKEGSSNISEAPKSLRVSKILQVFDEDKAGSRCVDAFKESDSWD